MRDFATVRALERHLRNAGVPKSLATKISSQVTDETARRLLPLRVRFWIVARAMTARPRKI